MENHILTALSIFLYCMLYVSIFQNQVFQRCLIIFSLILTQDSYNTRLSSKSSFPLPNIRTNYKKLNIKFFGLKVWNQVNESMKTLSLRCFKRELKRIDLLFS